MIETDIEGNPETVGVCYKPTAGGDPKIVDVKLQDRSVMHLLSYLQIQRLRSALIVKLGERSLQEVIDEQVAHLKARKPTAARGNFHPKPVI